MITTGVINPSIRYDPVGASLGGSTEHDGSMGQMLQVMQMQNRLNALKLKFPEFAADAERLIGDLDRLQNPQTVSMLLRHADTLAKAMEHSGFVDDMRDDTEALVRQQQRAAWFRAKREMQTFDWLKTSFPGMSEDKIASITPTITSMMDDPNNQAGQDIAQFMRQPEQMQVGRVRHQAALREIDDLLQRAQLPDTDPRHVPADHAQLISSVRDDNYGAVSPAAQEHIRRYAETRDPSHLQRAQEVHLNGRIQTTNNVIAGMGDPNIRAALDREFAGKSDAERDQMIRSYDRDSKEARDARAAWAAAQSRPGGLDNLPEEERRNIERHKALSTLRDTLEFAVPTRAVVGHFNVMKAELVRIHGQEQGTRMAEQRLGDLLSGSTSQVIARLEERGITSSESRHEFTAMLDRVDPSKRVEAFTLMADPAQMRSPEGREKLRELMNGPRSFAEMSEIVGKVQDQEYADMRNAPVQSASADMSGSAPSLERARAAALAATQGSTPQTSEDVSRGENVTPVQVASVRSADVGASMSA